MSTAAKKIDDMADHRYAGQFRSGIIRAKKILLAAGFPWSVTTGRYYPYGNEQRTSAGVRVQRIGCSSTISVNVYDGVRHYGPSASEDRRWMLALAVQALRDAGLPFDDRGWLECEDS